MLSAPPNPRPQPPRSADRGNGDYFIPPTSRGRAIDQSIGPAQRYTMDAPRYNPRDRNSDIQVSGAQVGSDWIHDLQEWWYAHRIYPPGAGERGESGTVQLHLQVDRTGKVLSVEVVSTSGSKLLDTGALATFRGRNLPPFPVNTPENMADINLTIQYILTR